MRWIVGLVSAVVLVALLVLGLIALVPTERIAGLGPRLGNPLCRQPRIVDRQPHPESRQHPGQRPAQIAEAHDSHLGPGQQPRPCIARPAPHLAPRPEIRIAVVDAAQQRQREPQPDLGHRPRKHRPRRHHMDAPRECRRVRHVVQQVALDIEDTAQRRHPRQCALAQRRLPDDVAHLPQHRVRQVRQLVVRRLDHAVTGMQLRQPLRRKDQRQRARQRAGQDQRTGIGHGRPRRLAGGTGAR